MPLGAALDSPDWHYTDETDADVGPVGLSEMRAAFVAKKLTLDSYVWEETGCPDWTLLKDVPELQAALAPPPPPPKVVAAPRPPVAARPLPSAPGAPAVGARPAVAARPTTASAVGISPAAHAAAAASARRKSQEREAANESGGIAAPASQQFRLPQSGGLAPRPAAAAPQVQARAPVVAARAPAKVLASGGPSTGKKISKLGYATVGDWTEMRTADGVPYYHNTAIGTLTWDKPDEMKDSSELASERGEWVWVEDEKHGFAVALLKQTLPDGRAVVEIEGSGGAQHTTKKGERVYPLVKSSLRRLERDLVLLDSLDEALILYNLRERFSRERQIYTNVGTILISINPYETFPIYGMEKITEYRQKGNRVLDPHVFTVADDALSPLLEFGEGENHSILISGESGAGKTWNTKQALSYLTEVTSRQSQREAQLKESTESAADKKKKKSGSIEGRILAANPILEGFGNAKTVRNDNSSRFGRFTEVHFDKSGRIHGARIDNFLLEKSRVVYQAGSERNYHVFYQLCKSKEWGSKYGASDCKNFKYLTATGVFDVPDVDDAADFQAMLQAFDEMGVLPEEQDWIMELVAGVLHIGNVSFVSDGGEGSKLTSQGESTMAHVAKALHVDAEKVKFGFTHRSIEVRGTTTNIPLKPHDAESSRDALAKSIYGQLFDWLVSRVNVALNGSPRPWAFIGLLDIFGFEIFKVNSFEQLCINFTNEKLQQIFNRDTFQKEMAMYKSEGVQFDEIQWVDNQPILDMIEKPLGGLLTTLDDMNRMPKTTDEQFVSKADELNSQSAYYINSSATRKGKSGFTIRHYAGDVVYDATGFLVKNKDLLYADLYAVMSESTSARTAAMFPAMDNNQRAKFSLGAQFRQQLDRLMGTLNATQTHYIRCIKPNNDKQPRVIDSQLVLEQLRYSGVFEATRIRKQGFPFRYTYERFGDRYKCLTIRDAKMVPLKATTPKARTQEILASTGQDFSEIRMGQTMVLYRSEQHRLLELLRALALEKVAAVIQSVARGYIARQYVRRFKAVLPRLQAAANARDVDQIDKAIADYQRALGAFAGMLPHEPAVLQKCRRIKFAMKEWEVLATRADELVKLELSSDEAGFEKLKDVVWAMELLVDEPGTQWHMEMFDYSKYTFEEQRASRLEPRLKEALELLEKDQMSEVYSECKRLRFEDPGLAEIEKFVGMNEEALLQYQYRSAKRLGMAERAREKEIALRESFLDNHMEMFQFEKFPRLRDPEEFAHATVMFWKREEIQQNMLRWTKSPVVTSLTILENGPLTKLAIQCHKAILGFCGDRTNPSPNSLAHELLVAGITRPEMRDEIYALIFKHVTGNESPNSLDRAWQLMSLILRYFPPARDFGDYVLAFFRRSAPAAVRAKFRDAFYAREYEGAVAYPPEIDAIPHLLSGW